jgi:predicted glycosyl hydrolase (DUF1957 family)
MEKLNLDDTENIIRFLEADDYRFRSGYAKEYCWQRLKQLELTERQKRRLRDVALQYLQKRMKREFWYMCRFIRRISDDAFRTQVQQFVNSRAIEVSKRASFLAAYLESIESGEAVRMQFRHECSLANYRKQPPMIDRA